MPTSPSTRRTSRPATGRSFLIILVVAALSAIGVTIWTFYSVGNTPRGDGAAAAGFKI